VTEPGTVTYLFTDIEGSTRLWEQAPERMRLAKWPHLKNEWVTGTPRLRVKGGRSTEERTLDAQDRVIR
jgi:hypothetical protein